MAVKLRVEKDESRTWEPDRQVSAGIYKQHGQKSPWFSNQQYPLGAPIA